MWSSSHRWACPCILTSCSDSLPLGGLLLGWNLTLLRKSPGIWSPVLELSGAPDLLKKPSQCWLSASLQVVRSKDSGCYPKEHLLLWTLGFLLNGLQSTHPSGCVWCEIAVPALFSYFCSEITKHDHLTFSGKRDGLWGKSKRTPGFHCLEWLRTVSSQWIHNFQMMLSSLQNIFTYLILKCISHL